MRRKMIKAYIGEDVQSYFRAWQQLNSESKNQMELKMKDILHEDHIYLYKILMQSFRIWDNIQTRRGAPGWDVSSSSLNKAVKAIGNDVANLLYAIGYVYNNEMTDFLSYDDGRSQDSYSALYRNRAEIYMETNAKVSSNLSSPTLAKKSSHCLEILETAELEATAVDIVQEELFQTIFEESFNNEHCFASRSERQEDNKIDIGVISAANRTDDCHFEDNIDSFSNPDHFKPDRVSDEDANSATDPDSSFKFALAEKLMSLSNNYDYDANLSLQERLHLRNIRIGEQYDSDLERQISPLISDEELLQ